MNLKMKNPLSSGKENVSGREPERGVQKIAWMLPNPLPCKGFLHQWGGGVTGRGRDGAKGSARPHKGLQHHHLLPGLPQEEAGGALPPSEGQLAPLLTPALSPSWPAPQCSSFP